jgi:ubiquinone/menaquinone biosynthesis C-methylase UbiE
MADDSSGPRGLDGLTAAELAASRRDWWDEAFTEVLLRAVPTGTSRLADVGCGVATAAHALLPRRPALSYVGVDADARRLEEARKLLEGAPYRDRVELRVGRAESLPFRDGELEVVLVAMTLQHVADAGAVLRDVRRVLRPGGILVAVEPDQTAMQVYLDGPMPDVTAAYRALLEALRRHRHPRDLAVGPALAALVEREGFRVEQFFPYAVGRARKLTAREYFSKTVQTAKLIATPLPPDTPELRACLAAIAARAAAIDPDAAGWDCSFVPVFVCVAANR